MDSGSGAAATAGAAAGAAVLGGSPRAEAATYAGRNLPQQRIGIQMYSMRDQVARLGFARVLPRPAEIGFREIEFAGFAGVG